MKLSKPKQKFICLSVIYFLGKNMLFQTEQYNLCISQGFVFVIKSTWMNTLLDSSQLINIYRFEAIFFTLKIRNGKKRNSMFWSKPEISFWIYPIQIIELRHYTDCVFIRRIVWSCWSIIQWSMHLWFHNQSVSLKSIMWLWTAVLSIT